MGGNDVSEFMILNHIVEVGEPMSIVVLRYHDKENVEEINKKTMMPLDFINKSIS